MSTIMMSEYVYKNHKKLRCGYTTGTCAAAATKAAVRMLLTGVHIYSVDMDTPKGIKLTLKIHDIEIDKNFVKCAVQKDAGDDADCTDKIFIYAKVSLRPDGIFIDGGEGIGRITKAGLEQPIGYAAINSVPRKMIRQAVIDELDAVSCESGMTVIISAPKGAEIAKKTFNPHLGIEGGISILGTSGIVEPMSEKALIDTIYVEMKQKKVLGADILLITPGNYGKHFAKNNLNIDIENGLKCSNYIGDTLDMAVELGIKNILFIGHIGKLIKVASGIMNTHSSIADSRMETLCACAILADCDTNTAKKILSCNTTDDAIEFLSKTPNFTNIMNIMLNKILIHMRRRTDELIHIEIITFSNKMGVLAKSDGADEFIKLLK